ncbi:GNAT family N-acetyltransferase, partial [Candidatus Gracilibacteria bacterium]|nr:GNAT family N-acetyltransferase [Candidatus Gracilibacteria bacterium]
SLEDIEEVQNFSKIQLGKTRYIENLGRYELHLGIQERHIKDIISYTKDEDDIALQKNTSDNKRFASRESIKKWYSDNGRRVFSLIGGEGELLGITYFRPSLPPDIIKGEDRGFIEKIKDAIHTSTAAIRLYPLARRKGLAAPFLSASERVYRSEYHETIICVDIEEENIPSRKVFEHLGYQFIGYGENKKSIMNTLHKRCIYVK